MTHDLVLDILERSLEAARLVLDELSDPRRPVIVEDLCGLLGALHFTLRRYRDGIIEVSESGTH